MKETSNNIADTQDIAMAIIANSGDGRSKAFSALKQAQEGNFKKAEVLIDESSNAISKAHDVQTQMLVDEANGKKTELNILTVHAQDHFMASLLANDLIRQMIKMQKEITQLMGKE